MINDSLDEITLAQLNSHWIPISPPPWELPSRIMDESDSGSSQSGLVMEPLAVESQLQEPNMEIGGQDEPATNQDEPEDKESNVEDGGQDESEQGATEDKESIVDNGGQAESEQWATEDKEYRGASVFHRTDACDSPNAKTGLNVSQSQAQSPKCDKSEHCLDSESISGNSGQEDAEKESVQQRVATNTSAQPVVIVQRLETTLNVDIGVKQIENQIPGFADTVNNITMVKNKKSSFQSEVKADPNVKQPMQPIIKDPPPPSMSRFVDPEFYSDRKNLPIGVKLHKETKRLLYDQNVEYIGAAAKGNGRDVGRYGTGDEEYKLGTLVRMFDPISKLMYTGTVCDKWDGVYSNNPSEHMGKHYYVVFDPMPNVDFSDYKNVAFPQTQLLLYNGEKLDQRSVPHRRNVRKPSGYKGHYHSPSTLPEGAIVELHNYEGIDLIVVANISQEKGYIFNRFNTQTGKVKGARTSFVFGHYEQLADLTPKRKKKFYSWINKREPSQKLSLGAEACDLSNGRQTRSSKRRSAAVDRSSQETDSLASDSSGRGSATTPELQVPEQNSEEPKVQKIPVEQTESKKPNKMEETPAGGQRAGAPQNPTELVQCHDHVSAASYNSLEKHCSILKADLAAALRENAELAQRLENRKVDQSSSGATTTATIVEANLNIAQLKELVDQLTGFVKDFENSKATGASAAELISKTVPHARKRVQQMRIREDTNSLTTSGMQPMDPDENELEKSLRDMYDNEEGGQHTRTKTPILFTPSPTTKPIRQTSQTRVRPARDPTSSQVQQGNQSIGYFRHERVSTGVNRGPYSRDNSPQVLSTTTHLIPRTRGPTASTNMINPFQSQRGNKLMSSNRVVATSFSVDPSYVDQGDSNVVNRPEGEISMAQLDLQGIIRTPENEDPHSLIFETTEFHAAVQLVCTQLPIPVGQGRFLDRAIRTAFWCEEISEGMDPDDVVLIMSVFERFHKSIDQTNKPMDMCCKIVRRFVGRYKYKTRAPAKRRLDAGNQHSSMDEGYSNHPQLKKSRGLSSPHSAPLPNPPMPRRRPGRPKNTGAYSSMVPIGGQRQGDEEMDGEMDEVDGEIEDGDWQQQQPNNRDGKAPTSSHVKRKTPARCLTPAGPRLEALFERYMGYFTERQLLSLEQTGLKPKKGKHNTIVQTGKAMMYRMVTFLSQNGCREFTIPGYDYPPFLIAMKLCSDIGPVIKRMTDCATQMELILIESALLWACLVKIIRHVKPLARELDPRTSVVRGMFTDLPKIILAHFVRMVRQTYLRAGEPVPKVPRLVKFDNELVDDPDYVEQEEDEFEEEPHEVLDMNNWPKAPPRYQQNGESSVDRQEPPNSPDLAE